MSIVIKKIAGRKYAYVAFRQGRKVVQKYLGPVREPSVSKKLADLAEIKKIPRRFYPLFWDSNPSRIGLKRNAHYVIERILELGDLDAVHWLQRIYPVKDLIEVFEVSRGISPRSRNFWRLWFEVPSVSQVPA